MKFWIFFFFGSAIRLGTYTYRRRCQVRSSLWKRSKYGPLLPIFIFIPVAKGLGPTAPDFPINRIKIGNKTFYKKVQEQKINKIDVKAPKKGSRERWAPPLPLIRSSPPRPPLLNKKFPDLRDYFQFHLRELWWVSYVVALWSPHEIILCHFWFLSPLRSVIPPFQT